MTGILLAAVGNSYGAKPVNTVAPVVSGTAQVRQTLSCTTGTWTGAPAPTFTYQWKANGSPISGATSSTYNIAVAYFGQSISCDVTATNVVGVTTASSNSTAAVVANVPAAPTIGTATATGSSTATVSYTAPADNGGATITSYTAISTPGSITGTLSTSGSGTITVTGLSAATAYTFRVYATNSVGNSAQSGSSNSITTPDSIWIADVSVGTFGNGGLVVDSSKNVYVGVMAYNYGVSPGQASATMYKLNNAGASQWVIANSTNQAGASSNMLFDTGGNLTMNWVATSPSTYRGSGFMKVNQSGSYVDDRIFYNLTGFTTTNLDSTALVVDSGNNIIFATKRSNNNIYVTKLNTSYSVTFQKTVVFTDISSIVVDSSNSIYLVGTRQISSPISATIAAITKLDSSGAHVWSRMLGNSGATSQFFTGWVDSSNNIHVCGNYSNNAFVAKYNSSGTLQWQRINYGGQPGTTNSGESKGITVDSSGNVYYTHPAYYGPGDYSNNGMYVTKLDSSGNYQWCNRIVWTQYGGAYGGPMNTFGSNYYFMSPGSANGNHVAFKGAANGSGTGVTVGSYRYLAGANYVNGGPGSEYTNAATISDGPAWGNSSYRGYSAMALASISTTQLG